jgi:hypothetical protein
MGSGCGGSLGLSGIDFLQVSENELPIPLLHGIAQSWGGKAFTIPNLLKGHQFYGCPFDEIVRDNGRANRRMKRLAAIDRHPEVLPAFVSVQNHNVGVGVFTVSQLQIPIENARHECRIER